MGDIHQFTTRHLQGRSTPSPGPAEVIIFPGVRVERGEHPCGERIAPAPAGKQATSGTVTWKDD